MPHSHLVKVHTLIDALLSVQIFECVKQRALGAVSQRHLGVFEPCQKGGCGGGIVCGERGGISVCMWSAVVLHRLKKAWLKVG